MLRSSVKVLLRANVAAAAGSRRALSSFSSSTPTSKFKVLGVQQIAIGGLDKAALSSFWVDTMGIKKVGSYRAEVRK